MNNQPNYGFSSVGRVQAHNISSGGGNVGGQYVSSIQAQNAGFRK